MTESRLPVWKWQNTSEDEFVTFWAAKYDNPKWDEVHYLPFIDMPLTPTSVQQLYIWKNGGVLSKVKSNSVQRNYIDRIQELSSIPLDIQPDQFLSRFSQGGAIWRIFWLHCWQPQKFLIFDMHVFRAMTFIESRKPRELADLGDEEKIRLYLQDYLKFFRPFKDKDRRQVDRALLTCGKFLASWRNPS